MPRGYSPPAHLLDTLLGKAAIKEMQRFVGGWKHDPGLQENLMNWVLNVAARKQPKVTRRYKVRSTILPLFFDIVVSVERLRDCDVYVRRFPFSDTRVDEDRYLNAHISLFLHECYALECRMKRFWKRTSRFYGVKWPIAKEAAFSTLVKDLFAPYVDLRGEDVHSKHFDDDAADSVRAVSIIQTFNSPATGMLVQMKLDSFKKGRKEWGLRISRFANQAHLVACKIFDMVASICVTRSGYLRIPKSAK